MSEASSLNRTILYDLHVSLGARMAPFAGYLMPISYSGIIREHEACRKAAAIFDTCHMGEILLSGPAAESALERLVTCRVSSIPDGRCRYGLMCNESGGVLDDLVVYRLAHEEFLVVVNAATRPRDFEWMQLHVSGDVQIKDISERVAKLDIQGPASPGIIRTILGNLPEVPYYGFFRTRWRGGAILASRTGYTGEMGFELYFLDSPSDAAAFWEQAMNAGAVPAGLGARDTLRLEMGMPLYGHELSEERNAMDSGFEKAIRLDKPFIGRDAVSMGGRQKLVGIALEGRSAGRKDDIIETPEGEKIGCVTSGSFGPSVGYAVAMGYVRAGFSSAGSTVQIRGARQILKGRIAPTPFYRNGTARRNIAQFL